MATTNKAKLPVGFVIAGKYRITGELGRGGMAAVYEAENVDIGKRVAIKILAQELISSTVVVERFLREARAVAAIRSPYICDVYDSGKLEDGRPFLVLELLEGESLYEQMIRVGQIDVSTTVTIINQTCKGLVKAHSAGIVHRDLKPENIFVTKDEEGRILAKILDFGLAKFYSSMETGNAGQARLTREGAVFGTPAYMSPEQVRGQGAVDSRADLWALACIAYESLTGRTVWNTEQGVAMTFAQIANAPLPDAYALRPDLPEGFRAWFTKALDRNIDKRFQTPKEFADELLRAMSMAQLSATSFDTEDEGGPASARASTQQATGQHLQTLDAPFESNPALAARTSRAKFAAPGAIPSAPTVERPTGDQVTLADPAKPQGKGAGRVIAAVAILGVVAAGAYGGYRALVPPTSPTAVTSAPIPDAGVPVASASTSADPTPSATPPYTRITLPFVAAVSKAQDEIASGDLGAAEKTLKDAAQASGHPFPKNMLAHVQRATTGRSGKCTLTGLGRPRTYDLLQERATQRTATQSVIARAGDGYLVAWLEVLENKQQAFAVALDSSLRPKSEPFSITPEGQAILQIDLRAVGDQFLFTYWESKVTDQAIYARYLHLDGSMASKGNLISKPSTSSQVWPFPEALTVPGKGLAMAYVGNSDRTEELFLQFLKDDLSLDGDRIRLTALRPGAGSKTKVGAFDGAVTSEGAQFFVRVDRDAERPLKRISIPIAGPWESIPTKDLKVSSPDASVGTLDTVLDKRVGEVKAACGSTGCYVVWGSDQGDGVDTAFFEKGAQIWNKQLAARGRHPAIATNDGPGAQAIWFEGGKLVTTHLLRDPPSVVDPIPIAANSTAFAPAPSIAGGQKPDEWLISWIDQEGAPTPGQLRGEVYVARMECK
ncbi:MAG: protein kinase [Polyangiaceae bacterium]